MNRKSISLSLAGDSGNVYTAILEQDDTGTVTLHCSCPAGEKGTLCKHLRELLEGNFHRAVGKHISQIRDFAAFLQSSSVIDDCSGPLNRLTVAEKEQEALKKEIRALKKQIARVLAGENG